MEDFEKLLEEMIGSFFNINLYGPSGCGKTSLLNRVNPGKFKNYIYIKFNLSDFYSKKNIFNLISKKLNKFLNSKSKNQSNPLENINKWYDLYQNLDNFKITSLKIYFIIDSILDMESFNYYKKELIKFFVASSSYQNMKIILISNFDITNSEIQYDYDFSSFISLQFPILKNDDLKAIIDKECYGKYYNNNLYDEIVNTCIHNFKYNFSNLNEILYNIKQNLSIFKFIHGDSKITEFMEKTKYKNQKNKTKKKKRKKDEKDIENIEMKDVTKRDNDFNLDKDDNQIDEGEEENEKFDKDIYTYNNHEINNGIKYGQKSLRTYIKHQTKYAPIHIMKLETFFKKGNNIIGLMDEEEKKENEDKNISDNNNQTKNLTESLSKSQKILLLASYLASEIPAKNDKNLFKAQKSKNVKKILRRNNNIGYNLKSNIGYPFNVHRLTAIYQSLLSSTEQIFDIDDIMVKCEIATLAKLGLIRALSGFDSKAIDQKYFAGINLDFARKIAEDYNISLEDYIKYEKID